MVIITDYLLQLLKVSAVLKSFCQSLNTIITYLDTAKPACGYMTRQNYLLSDGNDKFSTLHTQGQYMQQSSC